MDMFRRTVLKGVGASGALAAALAAGALKPTQVLAAEEWNRAAFDAKDAGVALKAIGAGSAADSKDIVLKAPDIAENGAVVPVEVISNIPNTISIAVMSLKNPQPLSAAFDFANGALPEIQVRVRLAETTQVKAVVKTADGKYFTTQKEVKVTVGGCGG
ncbi:MAG TPA: thiosulfate oxidation carrier protein SoxY [Rhodocyclaceae bacterium]|nr:thiosulfate oxidation carrier protein SoxY [Rhodocyclaceae bacterium]